MDIEDVSTEEFSDVSQDREEAGSGKPDSEQNEQIIQIKEKLKKLENDCLPELTKKWKKLENRAASEKKILNAYREFLRQSISAEYQADLNEAHSELEGKREELRAKLLAELEEKKRAVELERSQMDLCGNWIDSFENKTKRRLRPRESKEERNDDHGSSSGHGALPWLKKQPRTNLSEKPFDKRKRLGPGLNILLSESEINDDLKLIKNASRKRSSSQLASLPSKKDIRVADGKIKIGLKWFYKHETVHLISRDASKETVKITQVTERDVELKKIDGSIVRVSLGKLAREKFKLLRVEKLDK